MTFKINITIHPLSLIIYPHLNNFLQSLKLTSCEIRKYEYPDHSEVFFNIAYLDMCFEHDVIEKYLINYKQRILSLHSVNKTPYFKLYLLFSTQEYTALEQVYELHQVDSKHLPFQKFVLQELSFDDSEYSSYIFIMKIEDLLNINKQLSGYAMGYFYYLNHGRL